MAAGRLNCRKARESINSTNCNTRVIEQWRVELISIFKSSMIATFEVISPSCGHADAGLSVEQTSGTAASSIVLIHL